MSRKAPAARTTVRRKRMTGSDMLNAARERREAAMAAGVTEDDYFDNIIAQTVGLTLEEYRMRAGR